SSPALRPPGAPAPGRPPPRARSPGTAADARACRARGASSGRRRPARPARRPPAPPGTPRSGRGLRRVQRLGPPLDRPQRFLRELGDLVQELGRLGGVQLFPFKAPAQLVDAVRQPGQRVLAHVPTPSVRAIRPRIPFTSVAASGDAYRFDSATASSIA